MLLLAKTKADVGLMMTLESLQFAGSDIKKSRIKFCYSFMGLQMRLLCFPRVFSGDNILGIEGQK